MGHLFNSPGHPLHGCPTGRRETGLLEVFCAHGVGHPVPASAAEMDRRLGHAPGTWSMHGCDGCCRGGGAGQSS